MEERNKLDKGELRSHSVRVSKETATLLGKSRSIATIGAARGHVHECGADVLKLHAEGKKTGKKAKVVPNSRRGLREQEQEQGEHKN